MRLLVCGSRAWSSEEQYHRVVDEIVALSPSLVMHGGGRGADECADLWCRTPPYTIPLLVFRADWANDGKSAGPRRNARMLAEGKPDRGLAFGALWVLRKPEPRSIVQSPSWKKTGTGDMVHRMLRAGVAVRWVPAPNAPAVDLVEMPPP